MKRIIVTLSLGAALSLFPLVTGAADRGILYSGQTLSYGIDAPTYQDSYQFTGTAGERVLVNAVPTSGALDLTVALYAQSGVKEAETTLNQLDWQLQSSGTYTLTIADDNFTDPGTYNVSFLELPNGPLNFAGDPDGKMVAVGDTWSGAINVASDLDAYQFFGNAGDQVLFKAVSTSGSLEPTLSLYSQSGVKEAETTLNQLDWQLQSSGLYTLVISDNTYNKTGAYDISFHKISQVTNNNGYFDVSPQVLDDGRILWQGWDGHDYEIYCLAPGQGITQFTNNNSQDVMPRMNASGHLVWMSWDGYNWQVWCNLGSGNVQLTNSLTNFSGGYNVLPQITADDKIYWQGWDGHDYEIYRYYELHLHNSVLRVTDQLTNNSLPDVAPQVNASGQFTYMEWDGSNWQVCYNTGSGQVQVTTSGFNLWPQISDDGKIFWQGWDGQDYEIYRYTMSSGLTNQLTDNTVDDIAPAVKNGVLVWAQWDGYYWQIYREALATGLITQVTNDGYNNTNPQVNGSGQIVWMKWNGSDYDVYTYK